MSTPFDPWFPTSLHGNPEINVGGFGAFADGVGHPLGSGGSGALNYATLAQAQTEEILHDGRMVGPYPSATSLNDYADWCALTEAIKAAFTTDGVLHGSQGYKNRPLRIPAGRYITNKPVVIRDVANALIYGTGGFTQIYNENNVEPNNIALMCDGFCFSRVENLALGAVGANSIGLDINRTEAATLVNTNSNLWVNVNSTATNGCGTWIGRGNIMCSEQTFVRCINDYCNYGWIISNQNALSYLFVTSGGTFNTESCIRINTGGCVTCINCFFAENGVDIDNYASSFVNCIACRSESKHFTRGGWNTVILGCSHSQTGSESILCESGGQAFISGTDCAQSRVQGEGDFHIQGSLVQHAAYFVTGVSNSGGLVKITHPTFGYLDWEHWRNGDQVQIVGVTSTGAGAASVNGVWIINKLNATNFELVGSSYVADTYNITDARMMPGPQYATTGLKFANRIPEAHRPLSRTFVRNGPLQWLDTGTLITNSGASGSVTLTLPDANDTHWRNCRGTCFRFVVIAAQTVAVAVVAGGSPPVRIYKAGGYTTGGTQISSNVMGSTLELMLVDGQGTGSLGHDTTVDAVGHRWLVISETGTWTLSGTP